MSIARLPLRDNLAVPDHSPKLRQFSRQSARRKSLIGDTPAPRRRLCVQKGIAFAPKLPGGGVVLHRATTERSRCNPSGLATADLLAIVPDAVICSDDQGRIIVFNVAAERSFGYRANELLGQTVDQLVPERFRSAHAHDVRRFGAARSSTHRIMGRRREVIGRRQDGQEFPVEATLSRQRVAGRTILTAVCRELESRKEQDDLRQTLTHELDHRLRNILAVVGALVRITGREAATIEEFEERLLRRLGALARTQTALLSGFDRSIGLRQLLLAELDQFEVEGGAKIAIEGPDLSLNPTFGQTLSLVVHELATNAAKYGALSTPEGRLLIGSECRGTGASRMLVITWREEKGPAVTPPTRQGFGSGLIMKLLRKSFSAELTTEYSPGGLVCRIAAPIDRIEAQASDETTRSRLPACNSR